MESDNVRTEPYPLYSPGLAPNNLFLCGRVKRAPQAKEFQSPGELSDAVLQMVTDIPADALTVAFPQWVDRHQVCLDTRAAHRPAPITGRRWLPAVHQGPNIVHRAPNVARRLQRIVRPITGHSSTTAGGQALSTARPDEISRILYHASAACGVSSPADGSVSARWRTDPVASHFLFSFDRSVISARICRVVRSHSKTCANFTSISNIPASECYLLQGIRDKCRTPAGPIGQIIDRMNGEFKGEWTDEFRRSDSVLRDSGL
jgi:hypothetical protein